ncbi:unnamed protein product [Discosporangium mesarthrocarpum]
MLFNLICEHNVSSVGEFLDDLVQVAMYSVKGYYWILTARLALQWFPNINPYIQPWFVLIHATDWYLECFEDLLPVILGFNMDAILGFTFLEYLLRTLETIKFT